MECRGENKGDDVRSRGIGEVRSGEGARREGEGEELKNELADLASDQEVSWRH